MLIVGLGNPGKEYRNTRHNAGFMAADALCAEYGFTWQNNSKMMSDIAAGFVDGTKVILMKPTTFMNLSGQAVALVKNYYKIETPQILVIHDDLDLVFGDIRYKEGGGSGGHNGIKSLDSAVGNMYGRIRVGIDKPQDKDMVSEYVLSNFTSSESQIINEKIEVTVKNLRLLIAGKTEEFKKIIK